MIVQLDISYDTWVKPVQSNFCRVDLAEKEIFRVQDAAVRISNAKLKEQGYIRDNAGMIKRWTTGLGGEIALGKFLGVEIMDDTVGHSSEYNIGDLKKICLNIGVKSVEYKKFPLVHDHPKRCEIVLIKHPEKYKYMICGLYTPQIMMTYSCRDLVVDENVRLSKTAFYGIPFYKTFKTIDDLKQYTVE